MTDYFIGKRARIIDTGWEFIISGSDYKVADTNREELLFYGKDTGAYRQDELFIYDDRIHRRIESLQNMIADLGEDISLRVEIDFLKSLTK